MAERKYLSGSQKRQLKAKMEEEKKKHHKLDSYFRKQFEKETAGSSSPSLVTMANEGK